MKKIEFLILLILLSVFTSISAKDVVIVKQNSGMQDPGRPRLPVLIPLTADISPTELYLHFTTAVGVADITVPTAMELFFTPPCSTLKPTANYIYR